MQNIRFIRRFKEIEPLKVIAHDPVWHAGVGYYMFNAVHRVKLAPGERAIAITPEGPWVIFVGSSLGTCVFFETAKHRKTPRVDIGVRLWLPQELAQVFPQGMRCDDLFFDKMTGADFNIGHLIEKLKPILV